MYATRLSGTFGKIDMRAPVAQVDRAAGFEPVGREFESLRARHRIKDIHATSPLLAEVERLAVETALLNVLQHLAPRSSGVPTVEVKT